MLAALAAFALLPIIARAQTAHSMFNSKCAACHGADGAGTTAMGRMMHIPSFNSAPVRKMTNAKLAAIITHGKTPMPAFQGQLTKRQIGELVEYIRTLQKQKR